MPNPGTAPYECTSPGAGNAIASFQMDCNDTGHPDGVVDHDNCIGTPTRTGVGVLSVPLSRQWRKVIPVGVYILDSTGDVYAKATAVVEGFVVTNTVTIQTEASGAADDLNNKTIHVTLKLKR